MLKQDHLKDIDFRSREQRQKEAVADFKQWYEDLANQPYSELIAGQLTMLSAVLWYLLPEKDYKKLTRRKQ